MSQAKKRELAECAVALCGGLTEKKLSNPAVAAEPDPFWKTAVVALLDREFSSIEEAVNGVIDRVVERFRVDGSDEDQVRKFLFDLLITDPVVRADLRQILKIHDA